MYLLAGLMGMMALGSVAIVGAEAFHSDDCAEQGDDDLTSDADQVDGPAIDADWTEDRGSLFARMGLINMPWPEGEQAVPAADVLTGCVADAATMGGAAALSLAAFRIPDPVKRPPLAGDLLTFDPEEEQLLIVYEGGGGSGGPTLELRIRYDDPETTDILVNSAVVASLRTSEAPPRSAIVLVREDEALALDLV
jgi:hypothetical protein